MRKAENFSSGLAVLKRADFTAAYENEFYRKIAVPPSFSYVDISRN